MDIIDREVLNAMIENRDRKKPLREIIAECPGCDPVKKIHWMPTDYPMVFRCSGCGQLSADTLYCSHCGGKCIEEDATEQLDALRKWAAENPPEPPKTWRSEVLRLMPWLKEHPEVCVRDIFPWAKKRDDGSCFCGCGCVDCWNSPYVEMGEDDDATD